MSQPHRYQLDDSVQRFGTVIIGGSPLVFFRVTDAGAAVVRQIADGEPVADSRLVTALLEADAIHPVPTADDTTFGTADVTVVMPTFGQPEHTVVDAIVIDDGSEPPVADATIRLERNQGPGAARNAGLEHVTTPLIAFVDTDVDVGDDWLTHLLPHFADSSLALVAPRVRSRPGTSGLARYEATRSPLDLGPSPARIRAGSRVSYVPAAAIVCRTDAIREIGGFDTDLRFGEDVDLVWRLIETGWRCRYEPASEVLHSPRPDWVAWARQRIGYGSSAAPLARRHRGALTPLRTSGWSVGTWVLGAVGHPALGAMVGAGSAAALIRRLPDVPPRAAFRLGAVGNLRAGEQIASAIRRVWWPLIGLAALRSRAARQILVASIVAARHPIKVADDVAYSIGVWQGMFAERTIEPLVPDITAWPARRTSARRDRARSMLRHRAGKHSNYRRSS